MVLGVGPFPSLSSTDNFALVVALRSYLAGEAKAVWASQPDFIRQNYPKSKEVLIEAFGNTSIVEARQENARRQLKELRQESLSMIEHVAKTHVLLIQLPIEERVSDGVAVQFIKSCADEELVKRLRQWRAANPSLPVWDVLHAAVLMEKFAASQPALPASLQPRRLQSVARKATASLGRKEECVPFSFTSTSTANPFGSMPTKAFSMSHPTFASFSPMTEILKCEESRAKQESNSHSRTLFGGPVNPFNSSDLRNLPNRSVAKTPSQRKLKRIRTDGTKVEFSIDADSDSDSDSNYHYDSEGSFFAPADLPTAPDSPFRVPRVAAATAALRAKSPRKQTNIERNNKSLICKLCSRHFRYQAHLETHFECVHKAAANKQFECKDCDVSYASEDELDTHMRQVTHWPSWAQPQAKGRRERSGTGANAQPVPSNTFRGFNNLTIRGTPPPKVTQQQQPFTPSPGLNMMQDPENACIDPILLQSSARENRANANANKQRGSESGSGMVVMRFQEERWGKQDVCETLLGQENENGGGNADMD